MRGFCECGCGQRTRLIPESCRSRGLVKGQPYRFVVGHSARLRNPGYSVDAATGCWLWNGYVAASGYPGMMRSFGRSVSAHVAFYERAHGRVPKGMALDHLCRVRRCVNPAHLEAVTPLVNTRRGANTKLSADLAAEIRRLVSEGFTRSAVSRQMGISRPLVSLVASGKRWAV